MTGYECYAVLHQDIRTIRRGERRPTGPERLDGFHASEHQAVLARDRWAKRRPECRFRVAKLVEG